MVNFWAFAAFLATLTMAVADYAGELLWDPPTNEFNVYARVIELQHAGNSTGKLLATWEHWYNTTADGSTPAGSFIIRESDDDGQTWSTLSNVTDPQIGPGHPAAHFWQPFFFEFPHQIGQYPEGTILLVGNLVPANSTFTQFYSWRSMDHGATWNPVGPWQDGGPSLSGIWEPFLYLDNNGDLIAIFSDERDGENHSQKLVHVSSTDGGDTWGEVVGDVVSAAETDRPGMATVTLMDNGEYVLSYEICGRPMCPAHYKMSMDGSNWNESYVGMPVVSHESLFPQSSPYIAWDGENKRLVLAGLKVWYNNFFTLAEEDHRAVFINTNYGQGVWDWAPAPWKVNNASGACNSNYSPNLLIRSNGNIRYTAPTSQGGTGLCAEGTAEAQVGTLPYGSDFKTYGQAGWINIGGNWTVSDDGVYSATYINDTDAKAITGSTGWTDYEISADVQITSDSGVVGVNARMTAPMEGTNAFLGYMATINSGTGNITLSRESHQFTVLATASVSGGIKANIWYHLSLSVKDYMLSMSLSGDGISGNTTLSSPDDSFNYGMVGLLVRNGAGGFKNAMVNPL